MKIKYQYTIFCGILMFLAIYASISIINIDYGYMIKHYNDILRNQQYNYQNENSKKHLENSTAIFRYFINTKGTSLCDEKEQNNHFIELTRHLELLTPTSAIAGPWICEARAPYLIVYYPNKPEYTGMPLSGLFKDAASTNETTLSENIENILSKFGKGKVDLENINRINNLQTRQIIYFDKIEECNFLIGTNCVVDENINIKNNWFILKNKLNINFALVVGFIFSLFGATIFYFWTQRLSRVLDTIAAQVKMLTQGKFTEKRSIILKNETADIVECLNQLRIKLIDYNNFAIDIKKGNINTDLKIISNSDTLYNNLADVRDSILRSKHEVEIQKNKDQKRQWSAEGIAQFIEIFSREENNLYKLAEQITANLVNYLNANQGAIYILNRDADEEVFEMYSCFAYNRKKLAQQKIAVNDGLYARIYHEHKTIQLNKIPENYLSITSGLGESPPKHLVLTPLLYEKQLQGIVEIASFEPLEQYKIDFIEKVCDNIASSISMRKINLKTNKLLEQSQIQKEELSRHEKVLRNNMERMKKAQQKAKKRELKSKEFENAINKLFISFETDINGIIINMNNNFMTLLNYFEQDLKGKKIDFILSENENKILLNTLATINKTDDIKNIELQLKGRRNEIKLELTIIAVKMMNKEDKNFLFIGKNLK